MLDTTFDNLKNAYSKDKLGGRKLYIGNAEYKDGQRCDFSKPLQVRIIGDSVEKEYTCYCHSFTGLPVVWIETDNRDTIKSKEIYLKAKFKLVKDVITRTANEDIIEDSIEIRGRGNSSWEYYPKKSYRIQFPQKVSLLNEPKDKSWVLVSNYADKTMLRNQIAYFLGSISNLDYTPRFHYVELILNGQYNGTYQLGERIKVGTNRVNVGSDGFLIEVDEGAPSESDAVYFNLSHLENIKIKNPNVEYNDSVFNYVKDLYTKIENVLYSEHFKDKNQGWQKYLDVKSFADYYIIKEISKDVDGNLRLNAYMNFRRGEKIKMGPIWDFDISFGNAFYMGGGDYKGFYVKNYRWYERLFEDPYFVSIVKDRFNFFYSQRDLLMREINANVNYLQRSVVENENRWGTLYEYVRPNYTIWGSYLNEVEYLKEWINARFEWLKSEFNNM